MATAVRPQSYPRINDEGHRFNGFLKDDDFKEHRTERIDAARLKTVIEHAIEYANRKSSRQILSIRPDLTPAQLTALYKRKGKELFIYFVRYCGDPASTAYDCLNKTYAEIARENFRNRTIQKERMNTGWRYQHIAKDTAGLSQRFESISDLNSAESDFNAVIKYKNSDEKLNIYVSVKNRSNTMGGQDWPKAISALETAARDDRNRGGNYLCVFGLAIERGLRTIKANRSKRAYSPNTEVWFSDFFWPFFSNFTYEEIAKAVLGVLILNNDLSSLDVLVPQELIDSFGESCRSFGLLDTDGKFNDAHRLVDLFCGKL